MKLCRSFRSFALWFSPEHLTALLMAMFGTHVLVSRLLEAGCLAALGLNRVKAYSVFATVLPSDGQIHLVTLSVIVGPLWLGSGCQWYGLRTGQRVPVMTGSLLGFFVFFTTFMSCVRANFWGTGVPAYACLFSVCLLFFYYRCFRLRWIPSDERF
jgi:hypothetical protein